MPLGKFGTVNNSSNNSGENSSISFILNFLIASLAVILPCIKYLAISSEFAKLKKYLVSFSK